MRGVTRNLKAIIENEDQFVVLVTMPLIGSATRPPSVPADQRQHRPRKYACPGERANAPRVEWPPGCYISPATHR